MTEKKHAPRQANWPEMLWRWKQEELIQKWKEGSLDRDLLLSRVLAWQDIILKKMADQHAWDKEREWRLKELERQATEAVQRLAVIENQQEREARLIKHLIERTKLG